jgi:hypothetical protein
MPSRNRTPTSSALLQEPAGPCYQNQNQEKNQYQAQNQEKNSGETQNQEKNQQNYATQAKNAHQLGPRTGAGKATAHLPR